MKDDRQHRRCVEWPQLPERETVREPPAMRRSKKTYRYSDDPPSATVCVFDAYHTEQHSAGTQKGGYPDKELHKPRPFDFVLRSRTHRFPIEISIRPIEP